MYIYLVTYFYSLFSTSILSFLRSLAALYRKGAATKRSHHEQLAERFRAADASSSPLEAAPKDGVSGWKASLGLLSGHAPQSAEGLNALLSACARAKQLGSKKLSDRPSN